MPTRFSIHGPMVCGREQAEIRKYRMLIGKSGKRWMIAIQPNEADNIYAEGGKNSDGFGGATLTFELGNGETVALQGPWKTSASELLKDTGHDATKTHTSQGIIALHHVSDWERGDVYVGVLHQDDAAVIGDFERISCLAQNLADKRSERVYFAVRTSGGGHAGSKLPEPPDA